MSSLNSVLGNFLFFFHSIKWDKKWILLQKFSPFLYTSTLFLFIYYHLEENTRILFQGFTLVLLTVSKGLCNLLITYKYFSNFKIA